MQFDDLIGLPFEDGGRGPASYDCWGLAKEVYRRYGEELPDYAVSAMDIGRVNFELTANRPSWVEVKPPLPVPCLVVVRLSCGVWASHVGVHIGNGRFIHAYVVTGVVIERLGSTHWRNRIAGFYVPGGDVVDRDHHPEKPL